MNKIGLLLADMEYLKLIEDEITNNNINDEIINFLIKMCSLEKALNAAQIVTKTVNFLHLKKLMSSTLSFNLV